MRPHSVADCTSVFGNGLESAVLQLVATSQVHGLQTPQPTREVEDRRVGDLEARREVEPTNALGSLGHLEAKKVG